MSVRLEKTERTACQGLAAQIIYRMNEWIGQFRKTPAHGHVILAYLQVYINGYIDWMLQDAGAQLNDVKKVAQRDVEQMIQKVEKNYGAVEPSGEGSEAGGDAS